MATCKSVVKQYKNLPNHHIQDLWLQISKKGIKIDYLRDILMFYLHHKAFPPPLQKDFDLLVQNCYSKGASRKMKNVMYQILEEVCSCMESSVVETLSFSPSCSITVDLLSCVLVGGLVPMLDDPAVNKLLSLAQNPELSSGEKGRLLTSICQAVASCPATFSTEHLVCISSLMAGWLREIHRPTSSSTTFFGRSDSTPGTEVDGTSAGDRFTVLTIANSFSDGHMMGVHTFSILRDWLARVTPEHCGPLIEAVREYCGLVVEQSFRVAQREADAALQKTVLCEVLDILTELVRLDKTQGSSSLLLVKRIQNNITDKFKADYRDICIFVRVLNFLVSFGETSGYNSQLFCEKFLGDIVYRSYSSAMAAFDITNFLVEAKLPPSLLQRFFPNLLKLVACHPDTLLEEFLMLIPLFVSAETAVELFHSLLDLPVMSATLCLHQAPALVQLDSSSSQMMPWLSLVDSVRSLAHRPVFSHLLRQERGQEMELDRLPSYFELLKDLGGHALVVTCSEVVPLLLDRFFTTVEAQEDTQMLAVILLTAFSRLHLLFPVAGYNTAVHRIITQHARIMLKQCPQLVCKVHKEIIEYISVLSHCQVCPALYLHLVWAIGEFASPGYSDNCPHELLVKYFEAIECVLYELLSVIASQESDSLRLLNVMCAALAKLASRCQDFIPRVILCLSKVRVLISTGLPHTPPEDKQIVLSRTEELLCLLRDPNIAAILLSSQHRQDEHMSAILRVLAHFADS